MHASLQEIKGGYKGLKHLVKKYVKEGDFASAMTYIGHCTTIASQFNWIYADNELEDILDVIAESVIDLNISKGFQPNKNNWVFFDDYCTSYVLALQWMTALSKTGRSILYITSQFSFENRRDISILPEIEKMPNVTIDVIQDGTPFERANVLYQSIIHFNASKVIMHKAMNSLIQLPLCVLPKEIEVYNINLGDQFFWLGTKHINYNIEFRPFGASVSLQKRGFRKEQLLMIPFYPANENRPFEGFPDGCKDKIVLFSGGDYYKTWDKRQTFWRLVKKVLDKHPNVAFIFAVKNHAFGKTAINQFIKQNHFEDRAFCINFRHDIFQVFAHCDIFMGTTPFSGSLMSQLAAINGKPILQYYFPGTPDDETEQAICINQSFQISFTEFNDFLDEADKLIDDKAYRDKQGIRLRNAMMLIPQFNETVHKSLLSNISQFKIDNRYFDNRVLIKRWFELEKRGFTNVSKFIYSLLGRKICLKYDASLFIKIKLRQIASFLVNTHNK